MDYPKYQINFMPESYYGYCSTACFMGILNYFRYTQFNMKDTRDVMKIAKMGRYKFWVGLTESEMAYALSRLGFKVIYTTISTEQDDLDYLQDPVWIITKKYENHKYKDFLKDGIWTDSQQNVTFDFYDTTIAKKILESKEIEKIYEIDIISVIEKYQNEDTLFILWLNANILYDREPQEWISWWHVVLCKWYKNWMFEIYDPGPYKKPDFIPKDTVLAAMKDLSKDYNVYVIRNGH